MPITKDEHALQNMTTLQLKNLADVLDRFKIGDEWPDDLDEPKNPNKTIKALVSIRDRIRIDYQQIKLNGNEIDALWFLSYNMLSNVCDPKLLKIAQNINDLLWDE